MPWTTITTVKRTIAQQLAQLARWPLSGAQATDTEIKGGIQAIVVLGCPLKRDGTLTRCGNERTALAASLYRAKIAPRVIFTGQGEAIAMAEQGEQLGIPTTNILIDNRSRTTAENAEETAFLLRQSASEAESKNNGDRNTKPKVVIVSQPFHLRRARYLFRQRGLDAIATSAIDSIQYRHPLLELKWLIREYAAWVKPGGTFVHQDWQYIGQ